MRKTKDAVQRDNRKALPKFLLILLASLVAGCVLGFLVGWTSYSGATERVAACVDEVLRSVLPWLLPSASLALLAAAAWNYRQARTLFATWDGEDEATMDAAESKLNWTLLWSTVVLVLGFCLLSLSGYSALPGGALSVAGIFLLLLAAVVVLQQRVVDLERRMNPEKQGSVYDLKFHKKWLDSCDEAEQKQIGQAAYRAFRVTGTACMALWLVLVVLDVPFGFGPLPAFAVLVLWGILQVSYILEAIRLTGNKQ